MGIGLSPDWGCKEEDSHGILSRCILVNIFDRFCWVHTQEWVTSHSSIVFKSDYTNLLLPLVVFMKPKTGTLGATTTLEMKYSKISSGVTGMFTAEKFLCHSVGQTVCLSSVLEYIKYTLGPPPGLQEGAFIPTPSCGTASLSNTL